MDSNEKSVILCEFGSFVQLIREKSASTLLVPGMTLAIPAQKRRRSLYLVPSGLQHSSNDCTFSLVCACSKTAFNPVSSLTAILSCRNCSSICSIASSDSFWRSRILCCCRPNQTWDTILFGTWWVFDLFDPLWCSQPHNNGYTVKRMVLEKATFDSEPTSIYVLRYVDRVVTSPLFSVPQRTLNSENVPNLRNVPKIKKPASVPKKVG